MGKYLKLYATRQAALDDTTVVAPNLTYCSSIPQVLIGGGDLSVGTSMDIVEDGSVRIKYAGETPAYPYVDLGLASGTLWMTYNLGASSEEEFGDYYAWAETEPYYESISWSGTTPTITWKTGKENGYARNFSSYKYWNGSSLTKYTGSDSSVLLDEDDAIYVATNGQFRIPTKDQQAELLNTFFTYNVETGAYNYKSGSSEWTNDYNGTGVAGVVITGNGNTMFIPAAGNIEDKEVSLVGQDETMWGRVLYEDNPSGANVIDFGSSSVMINEGIQRFCGFTLRGVKV